MTKADEYLYERIEDLTQEKVTLISKINKIGLELEEIEFRLDEMQSQLDDAFEVFSPRAKKNEFIKEEIGNLSKSRDELYIFKEQLENQSMLVDEDINKIKEALGEEADGIDYYYDVPTQPTEKQVGKLDIGIIDIYEKQNFELANEIQQSVLQGLNNLTHKCDICGKIVDVDSTRAKLELETMSKNIKDILKRTQNIVTKLSIMVTQEQSLQETIEQLIKSFIYEDSYKNSIEKILYEIDDVKMSKVTYRCIIQIICDIVYKIVGSMEIEELIISCKVINNMIRLEVKNKDLNLKNENVYKEIAYEIEEKVLALNGEVFVDKSEDVRIIVDIPN